MLWVLVYVLCVSSRLRATEDRGGVTHASLQQAWRRAVEVTGNVEIITEYMVELISLPFREGRVRVWIEMTRVKYRRKVENGKI